MLKKLQQIRLILISSCFILISCNQSDENLDSNNKTDVIFSKTTKNRILKVNSTEEIVTTSTTLIYESKNIVNYLYKDICDSVIFNFNYKDTSINGFPIIMAIWDKIKNDTLKVEFEFARPPYVEYQYYINDVEIYFESDSTTSYFHKSKINKNDSFLFIKCVFYKNGEKWKTFRRKQPI